MDQIKLLLGDAITKMKELPDGSIDLIIADPPYNLAKDYKATHDEYAEFKRTVADYKVKLKS